MALTQPRRTVTRRAFLSAAAGASLAGGTALVLGCGSGRKDPAPTTNSGAVPQQGGELRIGRLNQELGLDPHLDAIAGDITQLIYSRLYTWDTVNGAAVFNDFATELEMPDPDGRTFIFHLRPGVKIHSHPDNPASGEELTSEDCTQSFIRRGTALTPPDKRLALAISGTGTLNREQFTAALETPDPLTFSFSLTRQFTPTLRELAKPDWAIVPAKVIEKFGASFSVGNTLTDKAFGSGPFMLDEFRLVERIVLSRHPEYFLNPRPWLDGITFVIRTDLNSLLSSLEAGHYDAVTPPISREKFLELKDDARFTTLQAPTLFYPVIHFKIRPPFDDIRVREAVDLVLDRERFIERIWGAEANYNGPVPWPLDPWALPQRELRRLYPHDPERARDLLKEAGYADGFSATMTVPDLDSSGIFDVDKAASLIAADLGAVGIHLSIDRVEVGSFIAETILPGRFELAFFANLPYEEPDRPLSFYHTRGVTGLGNWNNYTNPEIDELIERQSQELDEASRRELIHEAQHLMIEEHGPQITLPSGYEYHARRSYVHYPCEIGESIPSGAGPWGPDIWMEKA